MQVLYYNNEDDKAISIQTTTNDEIILCRTNTAKNFNQVIQKIDTEKKNYKDSTTLKPEEILKIPEIRINSEKEFKDIENKEFKDINGEKLKIEKAIQTIQFELNKKGAKVTSEAGMSVTTNGITEEKIRDFSFDDEFVILIKEKDKDLPYFALNITNMNEF